MSAPRSNLPHVVAALRRRVSELEAKIEDDAREYDRRLGAALVYKLKIEAENAALRAALVAVLAALRGGSR